MPSTAILTILSLLVLVDAMILDHALQNVELEHLDGAPRREEGIKKRFCGRRLQAFVYATCGECEPGSNVSLSLLCCAHQCDMYDIIQACCPSNPFRK